MRIAIGADHAGFLLKKRLCEFLEKHGHQIDDVGTYSQESCDYPDFAAAVAHRVASGAADRGILICGTGVGMSIAANKVAGIRAALGTTPEEVRLTRQHNDANVLTLGARFIVEQDAEALADIFLNTDFEGGRHERRLAKIAALERECDGRPGSETL
jgi:ribose 5-phosphate isomerase B